MSYDPTDDFLDREDERNGRFGDPDRQDGTEYMRPVVAGQKIERAAQSPTPTPTESPIR